MNDSHHLSEHPLQVTTLALWLVVVVVAAIGLGMKSGRRLPDILVGEPGGVMSVDIVLGEASMVASSDVPDSGQVEVVQAWTAAESPPAMPELADAGPLPEVPEVKLPGPAASGRPVAGRGELASERPTSGSRPGAAPAAPRAGASGARAMEARMSAGRMPAPRYPVEARRRGQSGTVVVEFTVGVTGRVVSARLKEPCRWPILNREALRAVRGWKFPAGDVMTMQRPIVFQLR